jgi:tetratricopeptide (TPR) repeat protein
MKSLSTTLNPSQTIQKLRPPQSHLPRNGFSSTHTHSATNEQGRRRKHEISPPPQIKTLLHHATSLYAAGDLSGSKEAIKEIIKEDPSSVHAYSLLSHIHEDLGQKTEAATALVLAAEYSPRDATMYIRAGRMSRDIGLWQQAIKCYDKYFPYCCSWN